MIAGTFQGLGHEHQIEARSVALRQIFGEMLLKQSMADAIDVFIHLQHLARTFQVERAEPRMDEVEHVAQDYRHFHKLAGVRGRNLCVARLHSHRDAHHEIANALQIGGALQARKQLASPRFVNAGDGSGKILVDLALDEIEFFFAILDGQESHPRVGGDEIAHVESGVAGDEAGFQGESSEVVGRRSPGFMHGVGFAGPQLCGFCAAPCGSR